MCGSPHFIAPEVITGFGYDKNVDWWSYGVVLYELLTGNLPFTSPSTFKLFELIQKPEDVNYPEYLSDLSRDILMRLLDVNPITRLNGQKLKFHPWFNHFDWDALESGSMTPPFIPNVNIELDKEYKEINPPKDNFPLEIPMNINRLLDNF